MAKSNVVIALLSANALLLAMIGALLFKTLYYDELYPCEQLSWTPGAMSAADCRGKALQLMVDGRANSLRDAESKARYGDQGNISADLE